MAGMGKGEEGIREEKRLSPTMAWERGDKEAIWHLKQNIAQGKHWYIALLEAMALWSSPEDNYQGRNYRFLIDGEAFDWLSLAERLCLEVDGLIPEEERDALLLSGKPPLELTKEEFKNFVGSTKYRGYLNYLYGIVVEEALQLAVEEEARKECLSTMVCREEGIIIDEVYRRLYDVDFRTALHRFRAGKGYAQRKSLTLTARKEFTYWLFKYRLKQWDKARVASDTKKALNYLQRHQSAVDSSSPQTSMTDAAHTVELSLENYSC